MNELMNGVHRFSGGTLNWLRDIVILLVGTYLVIHPIFHLGFNGHTFMAALLNVIFMIAATMPYLIIIAITRAITHAIVSGGRKRRINPKIFWTVTWVYLVITGIIFLLFIHPMTYGMVV
ncbi:hypothetical protein HOB10_05455 [Candidatus Parcubacteria bacterium]|jgi:hypothetical protein|nr:hypothetical protein [Candidatus Parcubacteria bacterium]